METVSAPGPTALFITASPEIYTQVASAGAVDRLTAGLSALADPRINLIKSYTEPRPGKNLAR
jgi:hypothetical protein